jgi:hypothetical protein
VVNKFERFYKRKKLLWKTIFVFFSFKVPFYLSYTIKCYITKTPVTVKTAIFFFDDFILPGILHHVLAGFPGRFRSLFHFIRFLSSIDDAIICVPIESPPEERDPILVFETHWFIIFFVLENDATYRDPCLFFDLLSDGSKFSVV